MSAEIRTESSYAIRQGPYESNPPIPHTVTMYAPSYGKPTDQDHVP
jgi:hypothetical protein